MRFITMLLVLCLSVTSCLPNSQSKEGKYDSLKLPDDAVQDSGLTKAKTVRQSPAWNDTLTIETKAAVLYQPDSLQIERRMSQVNEEDFRAGADDDIYWMNVAAEYLEKQNLPLLNAKNRKYLKFVQANQQMRLIELDTLDGLWGIFLFDPKKEAYDADIVSIEDEYQGYFK